MEPERQPVEGLDLDPFGDPFQVDNVQIASGWRYGDTFTVTWDVTGDAAGVTDFTVQLLPVHPHDDPFLIGPAVAFDVNGDSVADMTITLTGNHVAHSNFVY